MNLRPRRPEPPDINLTPLIDVVFLLLIFFMVSTTFDREAELAIQLPESSAAPPDAEQRRRIEIAIDANGRYFVDGNTLLNARLDTLKRAIMGAAAADQSIPLIVNADANTPHHAVVLALDAARQAGLSKVRFATRSGPPVADHP
ncbi:MAG: biopolymer transporter ExbD [Gammaproteobacteria bacterium]|nr:biopolymer transporter ExbD [Gammaproteobacteria bacterium]